eukprot:91657_1
MTRLLCLLSLLFHAVYTQCSVEEPLEGHIYVEEFQLLDDPDFMLLTITAYNSPDFDPYCKVLNVNDGTVSDVVSCDQDMNVREWPSGDTDPSSTSILSALDNYDGTVDILLSRNGSTVGITGIPYSQSASSPTLYYDQFTLSSIYTTFIFLSSQSFTFEIVRVTFDSLSDNSSPNISNLGTAAVSWGAWQIGGMPNGIPVYEDAHALQLPAACCVCASQFIARYYFEYDASSGEISGIHMDKQIFDGIVDKLGQKAYKYTTYPTAIDVFDLSIIGGANTQYDLNLNYTAMTPPLCLKGFVTSDCYFHCYDFSNPIPLTPNWPSYPITDDFQTTPLSLDNLAAICLNIKWARQIYDGCTLDTLIWPNDNCSCPYCPCNTTEIAINTPIYTKREAFFEQFCVECTCKEKNIGMGDYGFDCSSSEPTDSTTTIETFDTYECPPSTTCFDSNTSTTYLNHDSYWSEHDCHTFCYCDDGSLLCRTGFDSILSSDDSLSAAFRKTCSDPEITACWDVPDVPSYSTLRSDGCSECPYCVCPSAATFYQINQLASSSACLSCFCEPSATNATQLILNCEHRLTHEDFETTCGMGATCRHGTSSNLERDASVYATNEITCLGDSQCGWQRSNTTIINSTLLGSEVENRWGCMDSLMCRVLGIDGTCVHTTGSISPIYFGCSQVYNQPYSWDAYHYCCSGEACNANADIPDDLGTCLDSDILNEFYSISFACAIGDGITPPTGFQLDRGRFRCIDNSFTADLSSCTRSFGTYYTSNMRDYIRWVYGCACNSLSYLWNVSDVTTKQYMETQKDDLVLNLLGEEDLIAWMEALNCSIASVESDLASGDVYIKPQALSCSIVYWYDVNGICICLCSEYPTYEWYFHPQHELSFDMIKTICPAVSMAANVGYCSSKEDLIWPDDECGCPYCRCTNDGWMNVTMNEYLFGYQCGGLYCSAVTGGYGIMYFAQFGDDGYPFNSYSSMQSFNSYQCPP